MKDLLPVIDTEKLQEKVNEAAMNGAIETIEKFYQGYESPYKVALKKDLENKSIGHTFTLPDIIGAVNDRISAEIDLIANKAIAESYIPMVKQMLTRGPETIKFSDILKEFISSQHFDSSDEDWEDFRVEYDDERYSLGEILYNSFKHLTIEFEDTKYRLGFHNKNSDRSKEASKDDKWTIHALPDNNRLGSNFKDMMELKVGEATLKIPFSGGMLNDSFTAFIASLVISETEITFDVDEFDEDMFDFDECHC